MADFVLVHGSGQNAASWERLAALLRARGHEVAAPDLPKDDPDLGLEEGAALVAAAVASPSAVVVAHSASGAFLPLVPGIRACGRLVFLAAVIPEPGKSLRDQLGEDPAMFSPQWLAAGRVWLDPAAREELAREFLFHDCDAATVGWAMQSLEPMDTTRLVVQPNPLPRWPTVPATSIVARNDRTLSPDWGRRTSARVLGVEAIEVPTGHCPQVSRPAVVAAILERLVAPCEA